MMPGPCFSISSTRNETPRSSQPWLIRADPNRSRLHPQQPERQRHVHEVAFVAIERDHMQRVERGLRRRLTGALGNQLRLAVDHLNQGLLAGKAAAHLIELPHRRVFAGLGDRPCSGGRTIRRSRRSRSPSMPNTNSTPRMIASHFRFLGFGASSVIASAPFLLRFPRRGETPGRRRRRPRPPCRAT